MNRSRFSQWSNQDLNRKFDELLEAGMWDVDRPLQDYEDALRAIRVELERRKRISQKRKGS